MDLLAMKCLYAAGIMDYMGYGDDRLLSPRLLVLLIN